MLGAYYFKKLVFALCMEPAILLRNIDILRRIEFTKFANFRYLDVSSVATFWVESLE